MEEIKIKEKVIKDLKALNLKEDSILIVTINSKTTESEMEEIMSNMSQFLASNTNDIPNVPMLVMPATIGIKTMTIEGLKNLRDDIVGIVDGLEQHQKELAENIKNDTNG
ncbi:MAG: hypothetical protein ACOCRO_02530, partial [Halanaerobiales bacterium]